MLWPKIGELPKKPMAPSQAEWDLMSPASRAAVVASLPAYIPNEECASEGDVHFDAKATVKGALRSYFERTRRKVYVAAEIAVYYPVEERFAPDLMAVAEVETHRRDSWIVSAEGKGLDWVMEVVVKGDRHKDLEANVVRYARLGISEYFVYDVPRRRIYGFRLMASGLRTYSPMVPQAGVFHSEVLDLDITLVDGRLRFRAGGEDILDSAEIVERLEVHIDHLLAASEEAIHRLEEESRRAEEESRRADAALARGRAEALLVLLSARGLAVTDEARERVLACSNLATLDAWVRNAAAASTLDDVWG
ncbi:MAG: Uma2 family endonuclease [Polyangiales bacterium]